MRRGIQQPLLSLSDLNSSLKALLFLTCDCSLPIGITMVKTKAFFVGSPFSHKIPLVWFLLEDSF